MSNSNYKKDYTEDDLELEQIESDDVIDNIPAADPEEENWKDRYGNLRSHSQKVKQEKEDEINDLKAKLAQSSTQKATDIPVDPEQFKEWMETYPTVAGNIRAIVNQEIKDMREKIGKTEKAIETRDKQSKLEEAKTELHKAHPDFYSGDNPIVKSKEFWDWLNLKEEQGVPNHKENFEKGDNARLASDSLKLFKVETNYGKTTTKKTTPDGAASVRGSNSTAPSSNSNSEYKFTESQLENMNPREYDLLEEKIDEALRNGEVLMDISG